MSPVAATFSQGDRVRELLTQVDMSSDEHLMRISQHDRCQVGLDRAKKSLLVRQVLRATTDGPDRFVVVFWQTDNALQPRLSAVRCCRIGKIVGREHGILVAELLFPRPLARGEVIVTEYELADISAAPEGTEDSYGRSLRHATREYLLEVDFHPGALPAHCEERTVPEANPDQETRATLVPDDEGHTHAVALGFGPGIFEIRWEWDG